MFRFCLSLCIFMVLIGCQPNNGNQQKSPEPGNESHTPVSPSEPERTLEYLRSFAGRTENYDMLGVQESKDWLRKNEYTVTEIDDDTRLIQRNYVSGNITKKDKITISKGGGGLSSIEGTAFTEDDEGNIRVGFFREE